MEGEKVQGLVEEGRCDLRVEVEGEVGYLQCPVPLFLVGAEERARWPGSGIWL